MPKKTQKTTNRSNKSTPVPMPAIVYALAHFADPDGNGLHPYFETAWAQMPKIAAAHAAGAAYSLGWTTRETVVHQIVDAEIAQSRKQKDHYGHQLADAADLLEKTDPEMLTSLTDPFMMSGFFVGVAFAAYVLTNGIVPAAGGANTLDASDRDLLRSMAQSLRELAASIESRGAMLVVRR